MKAWGFWGRWALPAKTLSNMAIKTTFVKMEKLEKSKMVDQNALLQISL